MDGQKQVLICRRSNHIRREHESPREYWRVPERIGTTNLQTDYCENDWDGPWFRSAELEHLILVSTTQLPQRDMYYTHLWMCLDDGLPPRPMRLFCVCPKEIILCVSRKRGGDLLLLDLLVLDLQVLSVGGLWLRYSSGSD